MMPVVMMVPVVAMVMVMREAMTNLARPIAGLHNTAARHGDNGGVIVVRIAVIIGVVVVGDAADEKAVPMPEPMMEPMAGKARTSRNMADTHATCG